MKKLHILFTGLALLMAGCADDLSGIDQNGNQQESGDEELVDVTVKLSFDDFINADGTRSEEDSYGNAANIDMLVYAVRDVDGNILTQYGRGVDKSFLNENNEAKVPALERYDVNKDDHSQTILNIGEYVKHQDDIEINLRVMRGKAFNLTLWAQSSECTAYDFQNLENLTVDYTEIKEDNPDIYDAFCASSKFSVGQVNTRIQVTLTRALSQINLGVKEDEDKDKNHLSDYSKIEVEFDGLPTTFDVFRNKIGVEKIKHNFSWELKLDNDSKTFNVNTFDLSVDGSEELKSTTYKYLGMCYVLAPESTKEGESPTLSATITVTKDSKDYKHSQKTMAVNRNWRTNILFSHYKYLTPPAEPEELSGITESVEIGESVVWSPFVENYSIGLPALSGEEAPEATFYSYEVTCYESDAAEGIPLSVTRNSSETEPYSVAIPNNTLYALANKNGDEYPKLTIKAVSLNHDFYKDSDNVDMTMSVNWNTDTKFTWNFQGESSDPGKQFINFLKDVRDAKNNISTGEYSNGNLTLVTGGNSIEIGNDYIKFGGAGSQSSRNLNFKIYSPCKFQITRKSEGDAKRVLVVDFSGKTYSEDPDAGKSTQADSQPIQDHNIPSVREDGIVYIYSASAGITIYKIEISYLSL